MTQNQDSYNALTKDLSITACQILDYVLEKGSATDAEISEKFGVSKNEARAIRRDKAFLRAMNTLVRESFSDSMPDIVRDFKSALKKGGNAAMFRLAFELGDLLGGSDAGGKSSATADDYKRAQDELKKLEDEGKAIPISKRKVASL